jgi:hypothetical protein
MLAVADGEEIVGQYAGIPVRVTVDGRLFIFSQLVDNMVDRDYRRGLKNPGMFARLSLKFFEDYGGHHGAAIMYGFSAPENLRTHTRLVGLVPLHGVVRLVRPIGGGPHRTPWQQIVEGLHRLRDSVRHVKRFDRSVDRLWARCQRELRLATVRDAQYLNWRYADCPDVEYRLLQVGGTMANPVRGVAVLRLGSMSQPAAFLVDWLVPSRDWVTADQLLRQSCHEAEAAGMEALHAWMPPASPWHQYLLDWGFLTVGGEFTLVTRAFTPAVALDYVNPLWYYTMGDSDIY